MRLWRYRRSKKLGFNGSPDRTVIFVVGLIDRGPTVGEVMEIVT
jgi:hypothetical protein